LFLMRHESVQQTSRVSISRAAQHALMHSVFEAKRTCLPRAR
jgi:hypothetical protein